MGTRVYQKHYTYSDYENWDCKIDFNFHKIWA